MTSALTLGLRRIVGIEPRRDRLLELAGRLALGIDIADQREGQHAVAVQRVLAGQRRLAEHDDPDAVVGAQAVVGIASADARPAVAARAVGGSEAQAAVAVRVFVDDRGGIALAGREGEHRNEQAATAQRDDGGGGICRLPSPRVSRRHDTHASASSVRTHEITSQA